MQLNQVFNSVWSISSEDDQKINTVFSILKERYQGHPDPWGLNLELCEKAVRVLLPIYRQYFRVRVFGQENIEDVPYIAVSNHTGQIPIDGMLINVAFIIDVAQPRILRAMVERFLPQVPFLGDLSAQMGSILGDRVNCQYLLDKGESILVFPEGVRGISKNTTDYYKTQSFPQGFYRIAVQKRTPILPIAVVGAEEMFPLVYHAKGLAKMLGLPAVPVSANLIPLPSPIDIYIGKPIEIPSELSMESPDKDVKEQVLKVEGQIKKMLAEGLKQRRPFLDPLRVPLTKFIMKKAGRHE